jgi:hypothetical protein
VTDLTPASTLDGLTLEAVEWLPSGADTGLCACAGGGRRRAAPARLPVLCAQVGGAVSRVTRCRTRRARRTQRASGAGAYLCRRRSRARACGSSGRAAERSALPTRPGSTSGQRAWACRRRWRPEPGGEVIDRAVLAERARPPAEAAEQAQARVASEALRALGRAGAPRV